MKTLLAQRQHLRQCEAAYNAAASMLDEGNGVALIVARTALKEARSEYYSGLEDYFEEVLAAQQCEEGWLKSKVVIKCTREIII